MAALKPTYHLNDTSIAARKAELPNADFDTGCNLVASCAPGIGINMEGGTASGSPETFTLLDQNEAARTPQDSQHIGGAGLGDGNLTLGGAFPIEAGDNATTGNGTVVLGNLTNATLGNLTTGWELA